MKEVSHIFVNKENVPMYSETVIHAEVKIKTTIWLLCV